MDLNSLLASLQSQNSGQQQQQQAQQQPQATQNQSQNSLNDLLNSLKGISSDTNPSPPTAQQPNSQGQSLNDALAALSSLSSQSPSTEQLSPPQNAQTSQNSSSLDNVLSSIKDFTDSAPENLSPPQAQGNQSQLSSPQPIPPPLSSPQTQNLGVHQSSVPPTLASAQPQSSIPPALSSAHPQPSVSPMLSNPPQLSSTPPQLSNTQSQQPSAPAQSSAQHLPTIPPPNSLIPPPLSSQHQSMIPPPLSLIPPPLSSNPPQLSPMQQPLSSNPPQLSPMPPPLSSNPAQLSSNPPQLSPVPPPLSSNPPQLSPMPPPLSSNPPQLSSNPPQLSSNPPQLSSNPPQLPSNPPQLSSNPPQLSSNPPQLPSNPPQLSSNPPQLSVPPPVAPQQPSQPASATNSLQSLLSNLQKSQEAPKQNAAPVQLPSPMPSPIPSAPAPQPKIQPEPPQIQPKPQTAPPRVQPQPAPATTVPPTAPKVATTSIYTRPTDKYVTLDEFQIKFPPFDQISSQSRSKIRLEPGQTIQSVLDRVEADATIEIPSGNYNEEIEIHKPVTLSAIGGTVNLAGKGEGDTVLSRAEYFKIEGFNITQQMSKSGCALNIAGGYANIVNCTVNSPLLSSINVSSNSKAYIDSCTVFGSHNPNINTEGDSFVFVNKCKIYRSETYGILTNGNSKVIINGCEIYDIDSNAVSTAENSAVYLKDSKIYKTKNSGFETASTAKSYVENCNFSSIDACGVCANAAGQQVVVHHCTFTQCEMAAIKSSNSAKIRTLSNVYKDIGSNVMIIANDQGVIQCEKDEFEGTCLAGITTFSNGLIIGHDLNFLNISGSAFLSYTRGQIQVDVANVKDCRGASINLQDNSVVKIRNLIVKGGQRANLVVSQGTTGEIIDSVFNSSTTLGAEVTNTSNFKFVNCEFCDNKACGISFHDQVKATFEKCKFNRNGTGIDIQGNGDSPVFNDCEFCHNQESGANCLLKSSAVFNKCTFNFNSKIGIGCKDATTTLNDSLITKNAQAGITSYSNGSVTLNRSTFDSNDNFAGQAFQTGTIKLFDCKVMNHMLSFIASDQGKIRCKNTVLEKSRDPHFEVRNGGICSLNSCDVGPTTGGNGIQVHDNGVVKMKKTKVHHQAKLGIIVGAAGNAKILDHSVFENNGQVAIVCCDKSKTEVLDSSFTSNGLMCIQAQGGELTVQNCTISNHAQCAIFASKTVKFSYSGNNFSNNGAKDIVIQ